MYFLEEVTQDGVVLASAEFVQQRATGAAGEAGHGRAAILLVCIDQPVLQAVARPVQHLIFGDAPVARIAGRLPLIFHGQAGGIAVRGHQIAGAIPADVGNGNWHTLNSSKRGSSSSSRRCRRLFSLNITWYFSSILR